MTSPQTRIRYSCTECEQDHATFMKAAKCHYGIGGVVETVVSTVKVAK